jgi:outer membrane immunogenic protein
MVYATGGFAWADVDGDLTVTVLEDGKEPFDELSGASESNTHTGWTLGGGVEALVGERWSIKAEYLYAYLGEQSYSFPGQKVKRDGSVKKIDFGEGPEDPPVDEFNDVDLELHTFKIGLNYRIGSVREPMESLK